MKGCIQVYTGDGKGKTTAALGLALRAAGHGMRVVFCQFMKGRESGELKCALPGLSFHRFMETECFVNELPPEAFSGFKDSARREYQAFLQWLDTCPAEVVVLDEIFSPLHAGILTEEELLALLDRKPPGPEWVLTGRGAPDSVIERADLVTQMREIKHYFSSGVAARKGIEY
jgi:cob(I)alamin adenosyltransferase